MRSASSSAAARRRSGRSSSARRLQPRRRGRNAWTETEAQLIAGCRCRGCRRCRPTLERVADDPEAAALGARRCSSTRGSAATARSPAPPATCPTAVPGRPAARAGRRTTDRRTMPIAGTAYSPVAVLGRPQGQPVVAGAGAAREPGRARHGPHQQVARLVAEHYPMPMRPCSVRCPIRRAARPRLAPGDDEAIAAWAALDALRPGPVNRVFANVGKAIAAFERTIMPSPPLRPLRRCARRGARRRRRPADRAGTAGPRALHRQGQLHQLPQRPALHRQHFHNTGVPRRRPCRRISAGRGRAR
jgi:cytochrome c peroxidase